MPAPAARRMRCWCRRRFNELIVIMNNILKQKYTIGLILGIVILFGYNSYKKTGGVPGELDSFARCLQERGAKLYGASWCPHCKNQKELFGRSDKYVPYVECASPNGKGTNPVCKKENIEGYPTWVFADGSRESGERSLEQLATKTGCVLPAADSGK